jgi:hypothetical protein
MLPLKKVILGCTSATVLALLVLGGWGAAAAAPPALTTDVTLDSGEIQGIDDGDVHGYFVDGFGDRAAEVEHEYPRAAYPSPADAWAAAYTDAIFACPQAAANDGLASNANVYAYEFDDETAPPLIPSVGGFNAGASHGSELDYLFEVKDKPDRYRGHPYRPDADTVERRGRHGPRLAQLCPHRHATARGLHLAEVERRPAARVAYLVDAPQYGDEHARLGAPLRVLGSSRLTPRHFVQPTR